MPACYGTAYKIKERAGIIVDERDTKPGKIVGMEPEERGVSLWSRTIEFRERTSPEDGEFEASLGCFPARNR
jgi:hypothetical protein